MKTLQYRTTLLLSYRTLILQDLAKRYEIVVFSEGNYVGNFKHAKFRTVYKFFGLKYRSLKNVKEADLILAEFNLRHIDLWVLILFFPKKLILWGIGIKASYVNRYGEDDKLIIIRKLIARRVRKTLFYSWPPFYKYSFGFFKVSKDKLAVLINSENRPALKYFKKSSIKYEILFIGSVSAAKGLQDSLSSFLSFKKENPMSPLIFRIIGDGPLLLDLKMKFLRDDIVFQGRIEDDNMLSEYFERALFCVSLRQAGLSVMKSFKFCTPFVTYYNSYTGGERNNIIHMWNGFLLQRVGQE